MENELIKLAKSFLAEMEEFADEPELVELRKELEMHE
jgi:hypothetical protein